MRFFFGFAVLAYLWSATVSAEDASLTKTLSDGSNTFFAAIWETADQWYSKSKAFVKQQVLSSLSWFFFPLHLGLLSLPDEVPALAFESNQFRIVVPKLCEPSVKQYSGYFNVAKDKHVFFWCVQYIKTGCLWFILPRFFESRSSPSTDPLVLWMNGGPGARIDKVLLLFIFLQRFRG